ncbi:MAG: hypothetical protein VX016_09880 [Verrucomicrobiota bacterium]|nr:hypothetical protein [Verrucomicrobiales bacterium]MEC8658543.1 hypothetical protein [Verrucomicrobiota bacterium]MEC8691855.1 hypothetical protein [Verrucomicrobiota bacterium]
MSFSLSNLSHSAEPRTWTNLKGQNIKAQLIAVDGDYVILRLQNGRDSRILRKTLSIGDQKFLEEYGGAEKIPIDPKGKITVPEKEMKFNSKTLIKRDDKFELPDGYSLQFDIVESEHFLIMSSGKVRGKDTAELAERLWYGMNFQHPGFAEKWGDEKKAIFLCGEKTDYDILGKYYVDQLANSGRAQEASNSARTWPMSSGAGLFLDNDTCDKYNVMNGARAFRADSKSNFQRGVWNPFPAHCIAQDVLSVQMGGAGGGAGSEGYYAISTGHGYYKEIQLTDETVTSLLDANTYESDEVVKSGGFDDGKKWARTLRDLVKKEKVSPSLAALYRVNRASELTPELTVLMYGFARYMQSTPDRISKFSKVMERVDTSRSIPVPLEMAKLFGFETVQEFETDWINYLKSSAFK